MGASDVERHEVDAFGAFQRMLAGELRSPAHRQVASWVQTGLGKQLGPDWIAKVMTGEDEIRSRVFAFTFDRDRLLAMVEFVIRLTELATAPGAGKMRKTTRANLIGSNLTHSTLMVEVAALAIAAGAGDVAFEARLEPGANPIDVVATVNGHRLPIETTAVYVDQTTRRRRADSDRIGESVMFSHSRHNVGLEVTLLAAPADVDRLIDLIEHVADTCRRTERAATYQDDEISIEATGGTDLMLFTGSPPEGNLWERIAGSLDEKARKPYGSQPVWVRADLLNGIFLETPWATDPLESKTATLAGAVRASIAPGRLAGVVLSSGIARDHDGIQQVVGRADDAVGIRTALPGGRAREVFIIPLAAGQDASCELWRRMYEAETTWLDPALARHGLPTSTAIINGPAGSGPAAQA